MDVGRPLRVNRSCDVADAQAAGLIEFGQHVGHAAGVVVGLGSMELAEIEYQHPPSVITLKALSTGITKSNRTQRGRAYEHTTLADIVRRIARRLRLKVTGTIKHIPIERVTQYQERDVEFLTRLANAKLVAGQTVQLKGFGKFSGKYLVKQARHEIRRGSGFTSDLEVKMVEYVPDEPPQPAAATQPKKQAAKNANP